MPVVTVTVFLVFLIVSFCTNSENRKFYKRTYNAIVSGEYVLADDSTSHGTRMKYFVPPQYVNEHWRCRDQVILFYEKGKPDSIKLLSRRNYYIHNYGFPMTDFYIPGSGVLAPVGYGLVLVDFKFWKFLYNCNAKCVRKL